jgi:hypothetical protein
VTAFYDDKKLDGISMKDISMKIKDLSPSQSISVKIAYSLPKVKIENVEFKSQLDPVALITQTAGKMTELNVDSVQENAILISWEPVDSGLV